MTGTPIDQLHCPTCGTPYGWPLEVHREETHDYLSMAPTTRIVAVPPVPYIQCGYAHKWTLKQLTRSMNAPDKLLLGQYIGQ